MINSKPIYMDYHATTPVDPVVLDTMLPYFTEQFGNAASIDHLHGHDAQQAVESSREKIASLIGAKDSREIVFTSGATESDNIALLGTAESYSSRGNHIIVTAIEHKAILEVAGLLAEKGFSITVIPPDSRGMVDPDLIRDAITDKTILISVMFANNEIGTIQDVSTIGSIAREHGVFFHTDAAQAVGHIPVDVESMNIDLMSFTAHKLCGPKGIGALYVRRKRPRVRPAAVIHGGGHERGIRSGTLNVPGIVGFAKAMEIAHSEMKDENARLGKWTNFMLANFMDNLTGVQRNGHSNNRLSHNLNVYIPGIESKSMLMELSNQVAFSSGSACTSAKIEPSHVIESLGLGEDRAHCSLRFGLGRFNTFKEVETVSELVVETSRRLKETYTKIT